jgi:hypothetical protein
MTPQAGAADAQGGTEVGSETSAAEPRR